MKEFSKWFRIAIVNLLIVVLLGVILRYKIAFSLPFIDQKNLLQAHSHFAFAGWITQMLMTMIVFYLHHHGIQGALKRYGPILILNLVTAFGMLLSFPFEGYGLISIIFSTLSIFVSYAFAILFFNDVRQIKNEISASWLKAAVVFNAFSSIGAFSLAFMMATHQLHERWYLSAIYFFLHFQYNGWFFFAISGMLMDKFQKLGLVIRKEKLIFRIFFLACFPAYFLSVLWMKLPMIVFIIILISAFAQLVAWYLLVKDILAQKAILSNNISIQSGRLLKLSALAFTIKLLLQAGSTHPALSQIAFGFRPIVIGYLHLVLLGVITLFLLGWIVMEKAVSISKLFFTGTAVFATGIILNEILLMLQGVCGMQGVTVPYVNQMLFAVALLMLTGVTLIQRWNKLTIAKGI